MAELTWDEKVDRIIDVLEDEALMRRSHIGVEQVAERILNAIGETNE